MFAWSKKVTIEFGVRVGQIAAEIGIPPDWLMACMYFETGGTFSPSIKNKYSGATGLIQFMPRTCEHLGITIDELEQMTDVEQLEYVLKYFEPYKGRLYSLDDTYMAILWPRAIGHDDDYVLFDADRNSIAYGQNSGLDRNNDGKVTKAEACYRVRALLVEGQRDENMA